MSPVEIRRVQDDEPVGAGGGSAVFANGEQTSNTSQLADIPLSPRYAALGTPFHQPVDPAPLPEVQMAHLNVPLLEELGLSADESMSERLLQVFAGNASWPGYMSTASVYAGHQFGTWVRQLGDGRALLIAEVHRPDGSRAELQLKGVGPTPYSRGSDGRAVLRSSVREYLCAEAMHALGIPTTRSLSLVASLGLVQREQTETAAVVCRVSDSFTRFGQFEFFSFHGQIDEMFRLADHLIDDFAPHWSGLPDRHARWFGEVVERTARLMAQWQTVGFCHGVMNTDNFSMLGLTLDYGPFGFMDGFRQHHICNHSDYEGRYAYGEQPQVGQWNCSRLLNAVLPLLAERQEEGAEIGNEIFQRYAAVYNETVMRRWGDKLGLIESREEDSELLNRFLSILHRGKNDFTLNFRRLASVKVNEDGPAIGIREHITDLEAFDVWIADYRKRLRSEQNTDDFERAARMNRVNPKYVLRNHLAQAAIEKAERRDFSEIDTLMKLLARPFDEQPSMEAYAAEPPEAMRHIEVSCSS